MSPEKLRGRVLSITLLDNALSPVFGLLVGVIADNWGVNVGYYMLSLGCFVIILIVLLIYPRIKNISWRCNKRVSSRLLLGFKN